MRNLIDTKIEMKYHSRWWSNMDIYKLMDRVEELESKIIYADNNEENFMDLLELTYYYVKLGKREEELLDKILYILDDYQEKDIDGSYMVELILTLCDCQYEDYDFAVSRSEYIKKILRKVHLFDCNSNCREYYENKMRLLYKEAERTYVKFCDRQ